MLAAADAGHPTPRKQCSDLGGGCQRFGRPVDLREAGGSSRKPLASPSAGGYHVRMIKALTHVAVRVMDIDKALAFYCGVLGLREQFRLQGKNGPPWLVYVKIAEGQFIELFPGASGSHEERTTAGPAHLCLEVDDIHATFAELTGRGMVPKDGKGPHYAADNAWQFWTADPDGNPIEFHQFTDESMQLQKPRG